MAHPTKRSRQQRRKKHYKAPSKTGSKIHSVHSKPAQNEHRPPPRQQPQRAQEPRPARAETAQSTDSNPSPAQVAQSVCAVDHRYIPDDFWHPWLEARLNDQIDPREVSILIQLNDYLFSREHQTHGFDQPMSVAERSLIIFGNEKLLKASFNAPVLKSATFTLSDIGCVKNEQPLTYRHQPKAHGKPILLVENLVSYNHAVEDNKRDPRYSAVVYSEGCALQSRVDQVVELMDTLESKCCEIFFDMGTSGFAMAQQVKNAVMSHPDRPENVGVRLSKRHYRALMKSPAVADEQRSNEDHFTRWHNLIGYLRIFGMLCARWRILGLNCPRKRSVLLKDGRQTEVGIKREWRNTSSVVKQNANSPRACKGTPTNIRASGPFLGRDPKSSGAIGPTNTLGDLDRSLALCK